MSEQRAFKKIYGYSHYVRYDTKKSEWYVMDTGENENRISALSINREWESFLAIWQAAQQSQRISVDGWKCADGSMLVSDVVTGVLELYPHADRQALNCLAELLIKTPQPSANKDV